MTNGRPMHTRIRFVRTVVVLTCFIFLVSCAERGELAFAEQVDGTSIRTVWAAQFRSEVETERRESPPRPDGFEFEEIAVSIPPTHEPGQISWPKDDPDPLKDFVVVEQQTYASMRAFAQAVAASDESRENETLLFVHGYNTTHGEAVYQLAQMTHDFETPVPAVLMSWPSAAVTAGYVYDRDSVLITRDQLEKVIIALSRESNRKLLLVGHSMGSNLIMETLREISLKGSLDVSRWLNGLVLMAPDIDTEVFRMQAGAVPKLPEPFIIMVAEQDQALRISALLTGREERLGSTIDRTAVGDLPISIIDVSAFATGERFNHNVSTTSPGAISLLKKLSGNSTPSDAKIAELVVLGDLQPSLSSADAQPAPDR